MRSDVLQQGDVQKIKQTVLTKLAMCSITVTYNSKKNGKDRNLNSLKFNTMKSGAALGIGLSVDKHLFVVLSLRNGPSNSLVETYHTLTKTKNMGKGQRINEQVFHRLGLSTGEPDALLCLAMASSIRRCCNWCKVLCFVEEHATRGKEVIHCWKRVGFVQEGQQESWSLVILPRSVQKRNPEGGGKATIISHLRDAELQFSAPQNFGEMHVGHIH